MHFIMCVYTPLMTCVVLDSKKKILLSVITKMNDFTIYEHVFANLGDNEMHWMLINVNLFA